MRSKQTSHIKQMKFVQVFFIEKDKWCLDGYEVNLKLFAVFSLIEKNSNYRVFLHFFYRNLKWKTKNIFKNWTIFFEKGQLIESQLRILMSSIYWNDSSSRKKKENRWDSEKVTIWWVLKFEKSPWNSIFLWRSIFSYTLT